MVGAAGGDRDGEPGATPRPSGKLEAPLPEVATTTDAAADESTEAEAVPVAPMKEPALEPLTPELVRLRNQLRKVLANYYPKHLNTREHSCWEVMHGIIAYGVDAKLFRNGPAGQPVNAIGWACYNQPCNNEALFYLDRGKLVARKGPGLQGHAGQFLAIVAQSHVPKDFPMKVSGKEFTIADLIEHEKADCRDGEELTFKLIGLSHYLDSDETWTTPDGQTWSIPRLIREELKQPIRGAACGGTHRLMGHSYAVYKRKQRGLEITGQFARAEKFIADYHRYAWSLQNSDGSFSTNWFKGREAKPDIDRRLKTSGHILEWMAFSLPESELRGPRMTNCGRISREPARLELRPHLGNRSAGSRPARVADLRPPTVQAARYECGEGREDGRGRRTLTVATVKGWAFGSGFRRNDSSFRKHKLAKFTSDPVVVHRGSK